MPITAPWKDIPPFQIIKFQINYLSKILSVKTTYPSLHNNNSNN